METTSPDINALSVCIFSDANFLALGILENLLTKNCRVFIITGNVNDWNKKTLYLSSNNRFTIIDKKDYSTTVKFNYIIYCSDFVDINFNYKEFNQFISTNGTLETKTLLLLPFERFDNPENMKIATNDNVATIYLGDLLGPRIDMNSHLLLPKIIAQVLNDKYINVAVGEVLFPLFVVDVAKIMSKWMFSFGPYGTTSFLIGSQISISDFWRQTEKNISGVDLIYSNDIERRNIPHGFQTKTVATNVPLALNETFKWLSKNYIPKKLSTKKINNGKKIPLDGLFKLKATNPKVSKNNFLKVNKFSNKKYPKYVKPLLTTLVFVFMASFVCLLVSLGFFSLSYKQLTTGHVDRVESNIYIAKTFASVAVFGSKPLTHIPFVGRVYSESLYAGQIMEQLADVSTSSLPLVKSSGDIFNNVLGNDVYDPTSDCQIIKNGFDAILKNISFAQAITVESAKRGGYLSSYVLNRVDFERVKTLLSQGRDLIDKLPSVLGVEKSKTYLVLFQNNMELRPAGGFIGSYGLLTFDGGRMSDLTINDVYSADGQLNGHVEPPTPIKNYLGEANWWLRDSNWDPDFPTSAKRAEWFLDKEVGKEVDGVISTDLFPIKKILSYSGPVFLPDFNMNITSDNLYEKTQSEVQDNFFPGTHKKASFLTALSRDLISEVTKTPESKKIFILKTIFDSFEERHLQAYLHDNDLQKTFSTLLWDGAVVSPTCGEGCYPDSFGVVEANLGVNKANFFVTRNLDFRTTFDNGSIKRSAVLTLKNSANSALGVSGKYKVYLRFLIPLDSDVLQAGEVVNERVNPLSYDVNDVKNRKEVGVWVEVINGGQKQIKLDWESKLEPNSISSYGLYIRKQSGVESAPLRVTFYNPASEVASQPSFVLTKTGSYVYNTNLTRDFFSRFSW